VRPARPQRPISAARAAAGARQVARGGFSLGRAVFDRAWQHGATGRAGQFAYNAFLATIPFLFVLVSVAGLAGSPSQYDELVDGIGDAIPADVASLLRSGLREASANTQQATLFLVVGVLGGLYLTGNVMGTIAQGLDEAYGVDGRPWLKGKVANIAFAGISSLLAVVATVALVGGPPLVDTLIEDAGLGATAQELVRQGVSLVGLVVFFAFLVMMYRVLPNLPRLRARHVVWGAAVAAGGWLVATRLFRLYVDGFDSYNKVYGSLGAVVVYLVFLYITGLVLIIGGEVNAELRTRRRPKPRPAAPAAAGAPATPKA
jgi:membrane protein